jgi:hypothetical protein
MSYKRRNKEKGLREDRLGDALVARRPTKNKSLSRKRS